MPRTLEEIRELGLAALRQVQVAKAAWLKVAQERGKPIPKPQYRPVIYQIAR